MGFNSAFKGLIQLCPYSVYDYDDCDICFEVNNTSLCPQTCVVRLVLSTSDDISQNN